MTETPERFLRTIAANLPVDRVAELHLFPSIRQGPSESGVAVIAVEMEGQVGGGGVEVGDAPSRAADPPANDVAAAACDPTDDAAGGAPGVEADAARDPEEAAGRAGDAVATDTVAAHAERDVSEPPPPTSHLRPAPPTRYTIYAARYRLAIKGPDRGKWEASVAAEADAPLVTLEAVVRGVRHRAGDGADTERLSGDEFRAALAAPAWTATT
jgi:hypothetical protein